LEASTELCACIDADDVNFPFRLERQVEALLAAPQVAALGGQIVLIDSEGKRRPAPGHFPLDHAGTLQDMFDGPAMAQPTVLFRRSAVLRVGNYRNAVHIEDYDLWLRLAVHYELANIPEAVLYHRVHERSSTVLAERAGTLRAAAMACFAEHAPALYGCTPREAQLLSANRHPFALPVIVRMARRLGRRTMVGTLATLRSHTFARGATGLLAPTDLVSRMALRVLRARPRIYLRRALNARTGQDRGR
jgi:hypothetical protein